MCLTVAFRNFNRDTYFQIHSLACANTTVSLPFSGPSSIPICYRTFPSTLFLQRVIDPPSPHLASISWFTYQSCFFQIHIQYSLGNSIILISSILFKCQNKCNLFKLIISNSVGFLIIAYISLAVNILQFSFSFSNTGPKITSTVGL